MPYDNNLQVFALPIMQALHQGLQRMAGDNVQVNLLVDMSVLPGMVRVVLEKGVPLEEARAYSVPPDLGSPDPGEMNSASALVLDDHLQWTLQNMPAKKYAIVFLGHGGSFDQMSFDEHPGSEASENSLSARGMGPILQAFRRQVRAQGSEVELVFLQQCGRSSIETLYNFRGVASALLASPVNVGAPNTYYTELLIHAAEHPRDDGFSLAKVIMAADQHYTQYATFQADRLAELPAHLNPLLESLMRDQLTPPLETLRATFQAAAPQGHTEENHCDLLQYFSAAVAQPGASAGSKKKLAEFSAWYFHQLRSDISLGGAYDPDRHLWSGISIFLPRNHNLPDGYANYPIYQDTLLLKYFFAKAQAPSAEELARRQEELKRFELPKPVLRGWSGFK